MNGSNAFAAGTPNHQHSAQQLQDNQARVLAQGYHAKQQEHQRFQQMQFAQHQQQQHNNSNSNTNNNNMMRAPTPGSASHAPSSRPPSAASTHTMNGTPVNGSYGMHPMQPSPYSVSSTPIQDPAFNYQSRPGSYPPSNNAMNSPFGGQFPSHASSAPPQMQFMSPTPPHVPRPGTANGIDPMNTPQQHHPSLGSQNATPNMAMNGMRRGPSIGPITPSPSHQSPSLRQSSIPPPLHSTPHTPVQNNAMAQMSMQQRDTSMRSSTGPPGLDAFAPGNPALQQQQQQHQQQQHQQMQQLNALARGMSQPNVGPGKMPPPPARMPSHGVGSNPTMMGPPSVSRAYSAGTIVDSPISAVDIPPVLTEQLPPSSLLAQIQSVTFTQAPLHPTLDSSHSIAAQAPAQTTQSQENITAALGKIHPTLKLVNQNVTRVEVLPRPASEDDVTHGGALPELSEADVAQIKRWMDVDVEHETEWRKMRTRLDGEEFKAVGGPAMWYEREWGEEMTAEDRRSRLEIVFPEEGRKSREKRKRRKEIKFPPMSREAAMKPEDLLPIRIEIMDGDHPRLRETFIWNVNDMTVTPEVFAQTTCDDLELPHSFVAKFVAQIREQISEYITHKQEFPPSSPILRARATAGETTPIKGRLEEEDVQWWSRWRKRLRVDQEGGFVGIGINAPFPKDASESKLAADAATPNPSAAAAGLTKPVSSLGSTKPTPPSLIIPKAEPTDTAVSSPLSEPSPVEGPNMEVDSSSDDEEEEEEDDDEDDGWLDHDLRIIIKLDITVGYSHLVDQFEWDLSDPNNSPELFAQVYTSDLGLGGEFTTAIAHDIREQIHTHQKSLAIIGYPFNGAKVIDDELRGTFLPAIRRVTRDIKQVGNFMPILSTLSESDMERLEKDREKETKRKKRQGRGRTKNALPDREAQRTQRTIPGLVIEAHVAPVIPIGMGSSRRAAAQAASATIASLAASENSDGGRPYPVTPQVIHNDRHANTPPVPVNPSKPTVKGKKGVHIKPPSNLPEDVYLPRARLGSSILTESFAMRPKNSKPVPARIHPRRARGEGEGPSSHGGAGYERHGSPSKPKVKEYADGLHPYMINGKWHCSVCGVPEEIAIGRRKGPLGEKTMCGDCGKYYHRYRRPNENVEYSTELEFHLNKRRVAAEARKAKKKGGGARAAAEAAAASRALAETPAAAEDDDDDEEDVPLATRARVSRPPSAPNRIVSPEVSDVEGGNTVKAEPSASKPPSAVEGAPMSTSSNPPETTTISSNATHTNGSVTPRPAVSPIIAHPRPPVSRGPHLLCPPGTPLWLKEVLEEAKQAYPNDDFGALTRPPQAGSDPNAPPEWRLKCYDCPGKLYTPGPENTLNNFVVHLKNRNHRANVARRLGGSAPPSGPFAPPSIPPFSASPQQEHAYVPPSSMPSAPQPTASSPA